MSGLCSHWGLFWTKLFIAGPELKSLSEEVGGNQGNLTELPLSLSFLSSMNLWCWEGLSCMAWGSLSVMTIQGACCLVWLTPHKGWDVSGSPHRKQGLKHVFWRQPSVLSLTWSSQCFHLFLHLQGLLFRIFEPKETACLSSFMSAFCLFGLFR